MIRDHRLGERRGPQLRDINGNVLVYRGGLFMDSKQSAIDPGCAHLPGHTTQNGGSLHPNPSLSGPITSSLKEMGYSQSELDEICAYFGADHIAIIDSRLLPKSSPASLQSQNDVSESKIVNIQKTQTRASKISIHALNRIHKQILLPLLRRPSLQQFKTSVLACAANINTPGFENLRAIETVLLSAAHVSFF